MRANMSKSYALAMIEARYKHPSEDESTVWGYIMNDHQGDPMVVNIFPIGDWPGHYSDGLSMEIGEVGIDDLMDLNEEVILDLLPVLRDEHDWVHVVTLWEFRSWRNQDGWGFDGDWDYELELLGRVAMDEKLKECLL